MSKSQGMVTTKAAIDVLSERQRQQEGEGYMPERDDRYTKNELAKAAVCYATPDDEREYNTEYGRRTPVQWPIGWADMWWKPKDRRRDLVRAAALLLAEIERLDREVPENDHLEMLKELDKAIADNAAERVRLTKAANKLRSK